MSRGMRSALSSLVVEAKILVKHGIGLYKVRQFQGPGLRLNIGCGPNKKTGWVNIDLARDADVMLDLREPLPFPDSSCSIIYSEHFLEHVDYPNGTWAFLAECLRVLEPGGIFSVGVPDTEWVLAEYSGLRNDGYFATAKKRWHPAWCQTEMEHINHHFRQGDEHRFAYDFKTLAHVLERAGFTGTLRRSFDQSLDSEDRRLGTIYAEARKPHR